ncbi:AraC-like DNA-binding protein [Friedmanniella endophytica]|uniref:AraC-like DNA-binding protein n=1 Tax=Microlunatus kandeliicorticis TaxID=1759536 RepID=A0A7W3P5R2_9ACTN|nr:AraC family transcriptional regulator [Microlunatus kandeliicorticis]MBA8794130.1 AraC-like DNA-binding protein [Microlunatus kandeliicorticis]
MTSRVADDVPATPLDLSGPPEVAGIGRSTHGVVRPVDEFRLPELWSLHLYSYHAELEVDGAAHAIAPGTVSLVPPGAVIRYRYQGPSTHLYAHLRARALPVRRAHAPGSRLRLVMSPGADLPVVNDLMASAVASAPSRPTRSRCDLWAVLLRLDERPVLGQAPPAQQHLTAAMSYVESRLPDPITVPEIAAAVGVSANHLTRVFTAELGSTVVGYVRRRRIEHARRLLASTTMSIAAVAASVGFTDLQAFNKTCRAVTGVSPRQLRRAAEEV